MSRVWLGLVAVALLAVACSPVERIAGDTNAIRTDAQALIDHGHAIKDAEVVERATRIDTTAADIHVQAHPGAGHHPGVAFNPAVVGRGRGRGRHRIPRVAIRHRHGRARCNRVAAS